MTPPPRRRPPHPDSPDAVPEDPSVPELLGYLGLPDPLDRKEDPAHEQRRADGRAVDAAARAAWEAEADDVGA